MSAKARGYDESLLNGFNAEFSMPDKLLALSIGVILFFVIKFNFFISYLIIGEVSIF